MGTIVAIGGGAIGQPGRPKETTRIDKEIVKLSGKKRPQVCFIPTASGDDESYAESFRKHYGRLGCRINVLFLTRNPPSKKAIAQMILSSDIVYVGGGNTLMMMNLWRKLGVDRILRKAHRKGIVLSGLSAGAICWFKYGNSDSRKYTSGSKQLIRVTGLDLCDALLCPHYDTERHRQKDLKRMMKKTPGFAIALDNCSAIVVKDGKFRVVRSKKTAQVRKVFWEKEKYHLVEIKPTKTFQKL